MAEELAVLTAEQQMELDQTGHVTVNGRRRRVPLELSDIPAENPALLALMFPYLPGSFFAYICATEVNGVYLKTGHHHLNGDNYPKTAWESVHEDARRLSKSNHVTVMAKRFTVSGKEDTEAVGHYGYDGTWSRVAKVIAPPGPPQCKLSKPQAEAVLGTLLTQGPAAAIDTLQAVAPVFFADVDAQTVASGHKAWAESKVEITALPAPPDRYPAMNCTIEELDADRAASWMPGQPDAPNSDDDVNEASELIDAIEDSEPDFLVNADALAKAHSLALPAQPFAVWHRDVDALNGYVVTAKTAVEFAREYPAAFLEFGYTGGAKYGELLKNAPQHLRKS